MTNTQDIGIKRLVIRRTSAHFTITGLSFLQAIIRRTAIGRAVMNASRSAYFAGILPSTVRSTSFSRLTDHLRFITGRVEALRRYVQNSTALRPHRPIARRSITERKSVRQVVTERCDERRSSDSQRLVVRYSIPFGEQDAVSVTDITRWIPSQRSLTRRV